MSISTTNTDHQALGSLRTGETVQVLAAGAEVTLLVTDQRVVVASADKVTLDIGFRGLRRIQFDIERDRPATLVIVPHDPRNEPQVIPIPPELYDNVTNALAFVGRQLAAISS